MILLDLSAGPIYFYFSRGCTEMSSLFWGAFSCSEIVTNLVLSAPLFPFFPFKYNVAPFIWSLSISSFCGPAESFSLEILLVMMTTFVFCKKISLTPLMMIRMMMRRPCDGGKFLAVDWRWFKSRFVRSVFDLIFLCIEPLAPSRPTTQQDIQEIVFDYNETWTSTQLLTRESWDSSGKWALYPWDCQWLSTCHTLIGCLGQDI